MNYEIFKLRFQTGVHIGRGKLSDVGNIIMADTLFSALCQEAVTLYGEEGVQKLVRYVEQNEMLLTDTMPVHQNSYYIPKPMLRNEHGKSGDSSQKKEFKKLEYIRIESLHNYLNGNFNPTEERNSMEDFGKTEIRTMASVTEGADTKPFPVGVFRYGEEWGLYFILAYANSEIRDFVEELLMALELSGIGGKRSAGLGKFTLDYAKMPEFFLDRLNTGHSDTYHMALSVSMAEETELEAVLQEAQYSLIRRSGFVASYTYAETFRRKQDFFMFRAGSTFKHPFTGIVQDVSSGGSHAVYRYGNPIFLEVEL